MKEILSLMVSIFGKSMAIKIVVDGWKKKELKVDSKELLLQTDERLDDWINRWGCLFMSLIFYYLFFNKKLNLFVPEKVNELYNICIKSGAIGSDNVLNWSPTLAEIHKYFKCKQEFIYEENSRTEEAPNTDLSTLNVDELVVGRYKVKDADWHFILMYKDEIKYNPHPTLPIVNFDRYDKLDKLG